MGARERRARRSIASPTKSDASGAPALPSTNQILLLIVQSCDSGRARRQPTLTLPLRPVVMGITLFGLTDRSEFSVQHLLEPQVSVLNKSEKIAPIPFFATSRVPPVVGAYCDSCLYAVI